MLIFQTDFLRKFWDFSGSKVCKSCRAWKMLSNAYFLAKFRFDTAENEPAKNFQNFAKFCQFCSQVIVTAASCADPRPLPGDSRELRVGRFPVEAEWVALVLAEIPNSAILVFPDYLGIFHVEWVCFQGAVSPNLHFTTGKFPDDDQLFQPIFGLTQSIYLSN